jgi:hypothetical protein
VQKLEDSLDQALTQLSSTEQRLRRYESTESRYQLIEKQSELMNKVVI